MSLLTRIFALVLALLVSVFCLPACSSGGFLSDAGTAEERALAQGATQGPDSFSLNDVAPYTGKATFEVNNNVPFFTDEQLKLTPLEYYSPLDSLGRCGPAVALACKETMPTGPRGDISAIKPTGWQTTKYDWIDGEKLYNRSHLIAFSLAGETDNKKNLITGTRFLNSTSMLPYEERVASYIDRTKNHVLYRVTPFFQDKNLVATGVLMEAQSIEDKGKGIRFCVWCYNVEPGVVIDYATGKNRRGNPAQETYAGGAVQGGTGSSASSSSAAEQGEQAGGQQQVSTYILNTGSHKFHLPDCTAVQDMNAKHKKEFTGTRDEVISMGYAPCGSCQP